MTRQGRRFCSRSLSWIGNNNQAISCSKNNSKVVKLLASRVPLPWAVFLLFIQNLRNNYAPPRVKRGGAIGSYQDVASGLYDVSKFDPYYLCVRSSFLHGFVLLD